MLTFIKFHGIIFLSLQRRNPILEKVIHSSDDIFLVLDPKVNELKERKQLGAVETASGMSGSLYARWKTGRFFPSLSQLLPFTQNLGLEMVLRDGITVEEAESNHSEEVKLLQVPSLDEQNLQNQLDVDLVLLINRFLISATLKDKYLIRDLLIRLIPEDL